VPNVEIKMCPVSWSSIQSAYQWFMLDLVPPIYITVTRWNQKGFVLLGFYGKI
jgi:hypothetical protein